MEVQLSFVSKEEAHKLIDEVPGNGVLILTYNSKVGISDYGKYVKKKKSKKLIDKSERVVLAKNYPVTTLNLHKKFFESFSDYERENIIKSILLPKLE